MIEHRRQDGALRQNSRIACLQAVGFSLGRSLTEPRSTHFEAVKTHRRAGLADLLY
jgi:hypothetical protein